jgi:glucosamine-6-phosphate isomerase
MESVYDELARKHQDEALDYSQCRTFNLDEYVGLSADDPCSYHYFMQERFFSRVNIKLSNTHLPDGMAKNLEAECLNYEKLIAANGGIGLQVLGIGLNGHLGFNEPRSPLTAFAARVADAGSSAFTGDACAKRTAVSQTQAGPTSRNHDGNWNHFGLASLFITGHGAGEGGNRGEGN